MASLTVEPASQRSRTPGPRKRCRSPSPSESPHQPTTNAAVASPLPSPPRKHRRVSHSTPLILGPHPRPGQGLYAPLTPLPRLRRFRAELVRVIHEGPLSIVLLVRDPGALRVLKIFAPLPANPEDITRDAFAHEYRSYQLLLARGIAVPPVAEHEEEAPEGGRIVPYCFGVAKVQRDLRLLTPPASDPDAVKRLQGAGVFRGVATALRSLVLEYIPEAVTVAAAPGLMTVALSEEAVAKLRVLHEVGILHRDPMPRNLLLVEGRHGRSVRWIDFDSAITTVGWDVHEVWFEVEKERVWSTLVDDVMVSEREGRMPLWSRWF